MKKLSKQQEKQYNELLDKIKETKGDLEAAIEDFNKYVEEANEEFAKRFGFIDSNQQDYNTAVSELNDFIDELTGDMETYYDERSEKWQEGDAGSNYQSWKDEWENHKGEEIEIDEPAEIEALEAPDLFDTDEGPSMEAEAA